MYLVLQYRNVYIEHIIYSAALAVIVGMIFSRYTGRDPSWIIIALAFVPDIDFALEGSINQCPSAAPYLVY
jgi:hypothetical protein